MKFLRKKRDILFAVALIFGVFFSASLAADNSSKNKVNGIDVSHYQGTVDWRKVKQQAIQFVYVKATGGEDYVDPEFTNNWHGTRQVGLRRGAYHFFYAADDAEAQAKHFLSTVGEIKKHDLPPVVDIEITDDASADVIRQGVLTWLQIVEEKTGRRPIIYSSMSFLQDYLNDESLAKYPLWVAEYADELSSLPSEWAKAGWVFWQYSQQGSVEGVAGEVDLDYFNGDVQALKALISHN